MKWILLAVLLAFSLPSVASHIVGGEFEIIHLTGNSYQINLILYFDVLNGSQGAKDPLFNTAIFRKRDNAFMQNVLFQDPSAAPVHYTQPSCSKGEIVTDKLVYTSYITMSDSRYNDSEGYYIIWERCCRNYTITNIYSNDPAISAQAAGQTFYLEFPPVVKNGQKFFNSTPHLFPPLSDYACPRKPYYVDFAGVDDDGDSLSYSLVTPLSTHTIDAFPPLLPAPYPMVQWRAPFGLNNILAGAPDLRISNEGFLTATPTQQGLFVFAVKCEEFRDGEKIGEVRRDFQMLVVDICPHAEPPQILGRKLTDPDFTYDENMDITFNAGLTDEQRCIEIQVSDADALDPDDNYTENVTITAKAIGFKKDVRAILPSITSATLVNGSTKNFQICFDQCPYLNGPFQIAIVAHDDACSLPLTDTLMITVNITPPPNDPAHFITADVDEVIPEGQIKSWPIIGVDNDGDQLIVGVIPDGFSMQDVGMKIVQTKLDNGRYEASLQWDTHCNVSNFSEKSEFAIRITLEDVDECNLTQPDVMVLKLKVDLPDNASPIIDSDLTDDPAERYVANIKRKINESLVFHVTGRDVDNDLIVLSAKGSGFDMADYNVIFPGATGNSSVLSPFTWNIFCDNIDLKVRDKFTFEFIVVDNSNSCRIYQADTLDVTVQLYPPDNDGPTLQVVNLEQSISMVNNTLSVVVGQQITLGLSATDPDLVPQPDMLKLDLIKVEGTTEPVGYIFAAVEGRRAVSTTFIWKPECSLLPTGQTEGDYKFTFNVLDDRCYSQKGDTVSVSVIIKDVDGSDADFIPPNIITPNGDNKNDFFAMVKEDPLTHELVNILPLDNCLGHFEGINIFNRWGEAVFVSYDRDFRWYANGNASGMYYYTLKYTDKDYKGIITVAYDDTKASR
ncbi:MAG: gliding motility-associated C-terminal domain-containing protein [Chryseolinea sp.]